MDRFKMNVTQRGDVTVAAGGISQIWCLGDLSDGYASYSTIVDWLSYKSCSSGTDHKRR
jgi:hypothetical protein